MTPLLPKTDVIFKLLMGNVHSLNLLQGFLSSVLPLPEAEYQGLELIDPQVRGEFPENKLGVLDVRVNTTSGREIDVEIQVASVSGMRERIQFYNARLLSQQAKAGSPYSGLKQSISVIITDFRLIGDDEKYHHCFHMYDEKEKVKFSELQEIHVLELPKLPAEWDGTLLWVWLRFFASKTEGEFMAVAEKDKVVAQAWGRLKVLSADENTQLLLEAREKALMDEHSRLNGAREEGRQEGRQEGISQGVSQAAKKALQKLSPEEVSELLDLPLAEVSRLAKEK